MKALMTSKDARILICETKEGTLSWSLDCEVPAVSENHGRKDQILRNLPFPGWCRKAIDAGQWVDVSAVEVTENPPQGRRRDFHVVVRGKAVTPTSHTECGTTYSSYYCQDEEVVAKHEKVTTMSYDNFEKVVKKEFIVDSKRSVAAEKAEAEAEAIRLNGSGRLYGQGQLLSEEIVFGQKYLHNTEDAVELRLEATVVSNYGPYKWASPEAPCEHNGWHWVARVVEYGPKTDKKVDHDKDKVLKSVPKSDLEQKFEVKEVYKPCKQAGGYYFHDVYVGGRQVAHIYAGSNNPYGAYSERRFDSDGDAYYIHHDGVCKEPFSWTDIPIDVFEAEC